jgi:hypothetical protein
MAETNTQRGAKAGHIKDEVISPTAPVTHVATYHNDGEGGVPHASDHHQWREHAHPDGSGRTPANGTTEKAKTTRPAGRYGLGAETSDGKNRTGHVLTGKRREEH